MLENQPEKADRHKQNQYGGWRLAGTSPAVGWTRPPPRPLKTSAELQTCWKTASKDGGPYSWATENSEQEHCLYWNLKAPGECMTGKHCLTDRLSS